MSEAQVENSISPNKRLYGYAMKTPSESLYEKAPAIPLAVESAMRWGTDPLMSLGGYAAQVAGNAQQITNQVSMSALGEVSEALDITPPKAFSDRMLEYKKIYPAQSYESMIDYGELRKQARDDYYTDVNHGGGIDYLHQQAGLLAVPAELLGGITGAVASGLGTAPKTIAAGYDGIINSLPKVNPYLQHMAAGGTIGAAFSAPHAIASGFTDNGYDLGEAAKNLGIGAVTGAGLSAAVEAAPKAIDIVNQTVRAIADRRKQSDITQTMAQISKQRYAEIRAQQAAREQTQTIGQSSRFKAETEENVPLSDEFTAKKVIRGQPELSPLQEAYTSEEIAADAAKEDQYNRQSNVVSMPMPEKPTPAPNRLFEPKDNALRAAQRTASKALIPTIDYAKVKSKSLHRVLSKYKHDKFDIPAKLRETFAPLAKVVSKYNDDLQVIANLRSGGQLPEDLGKALNAAQESFSQIYDQLKAAGINLPEKIENYFPTWVKDFEGLKEYYIQKGLDKQAHNLDAAMKEAEGKGIARHSDEFEWAVNSKLMKERKVSNENIDPAAMQFNATPVEALDRYIGNVTDQFAKANLFKGEDLTQPIDELVTKLVNKHRGNMGRRDTADMSKRILTALAGERYTRSLPFEIIRTGNVLFNTSGLGTAAKNLTAMAEVIEMYGLDAKDILPHFSKEELRLTHKSLNRYNDKVLDNPEYAKLNLMSTMYSLMNPGEHVRVRSAGDIAKQLGHAVQEVVGAAFNATNTFEAKVRYVGAYANIKNQATRSKPSANFKKFLGDYFNKAEQEKLISAAKKLKQDLNAEIDPILLEASFYMASERLPLTGLDKPMYASLKQDWVRGLYDLHTWGLKFASDLKYRIVDEAKTNPANASKNLTAYAGVTLPFVTMSALLTNAAMNKYAGVDWFKDGKLSPEAEAIVGKEYVGGAIDRLPGANRYGVEQAAQGGERSIIKSIDNAAEGLLPTGASTIPKVAGQTLLAAYDGFTRIDGKKAGMEGAFRAVFDPSVNKSFKYLFKPITEPIAQYNKEVTYDTIKKNKESTPTALSDKKVKQANERIHTGKGNIAEERTRAMAERVFTNQQQYGTDNPKEVVKLERAASGRTAIGQQHLAHLDDLYYHPRPGKKKMSRSEYNNLQSQVYDYMYGARANAAAGL